MYSTNHLEIADKKNAKAQDRFLYTLVESNCNTLTVRETNQRGADKGRYV